MANKFVKYTIVDECDGLYVCMRNKIIEEKAPEGHYFKTQSGKILGNVKFNYEIKLSDYPVLEPIKGSLIATEEETILVKEEE